MELLHLTFKDTQRRLSPIKQKLFFLSEFCRRIKLIKMVSRLVKSNIIGLLKFFEFSASNLLVKTFFLCSYLDAYAFIQNGLVFINKKNCFNIFFKITHNDIIELVYTKNYFFFIQKKKKNLKKHLYKFRRKHAKFRSRNISTPRFKKSFKASQEYSFGLNSTPHFIEIDYQSFIFILISKQIVLTNTAYM